MNNSDSTSQMSTEPASINKTVNPSNSQKMAIVLVLAVLATIILIIGTVGFISLFQSRNTNTAANSGVSKDVASNTIVPNLLLLKR